MTARRRAARTLAAAAIAVAAVLYTVIGYSRVDAAAGPVHQFAVAGQTAMVVVPGDRPPIGLVLYLHGLDDDHEVLQERAARQRTVDHLVSSGYVVAASDAHRNAWGNVESQDDYAALAADLTRRYGTTKTFLLAESMGAVAGLLILGEDRIPDVAGLAAISPLVDPEMAIGSQFESSLRAAYGGNLPEVLESPARLPAADFRDDHIRFYTAADDVLVPSARQAEPFVARLQGIADVSVVPCSGGHVADSCFQPNDLTTWFGQIAGRTGK